MTKINSGADSLLNNVKTFEDSAVKEAARKLESAVATGYIPDASAFGKVPAAEDFNIFDNGSLYSKKDRGMGTSKRAGRYHRDYSERHSRRMEFLFAGIFGTLAVMTVLMALAMIMGITGWTA